MNGGAVQYLVWRLLLLSMAFGAGRLIHLLILGGEQ